MNQQYLNNLVEKVITQNEPDWPDFRKSLMCSGGLYLYVFAEKLAEAVAHECTGIIELNTMQITKRGISEIHTVLNKHFGVEE